MKKIIFLKGLPGSGKTTWAKEFISTNSGFYRVNKDDIRTEFPNLPEAQVIETETERVKAILSFPASHGVIIDNTHFNPIHETRYRKLAAEYNADFQIKFFDVPVNECIARDAKREGKAKVGKKVIMDMYNRYCTKRISTVEDSQEVTKNPPVDVEKTYNPKLPFCIVCDIDGTIARNVTNRSHFAEDESLLTDSPRTHVINAVIALYDGFLIGANKDIKLLFLSGRKEGSRKFTEQWLRNTGFAPENAFFELNLLMRPQDDNRQDAVVKEEIFDRDIAPFYNVVAIFDDRPQVVRMWQRKGLPVFCVNENYNEDF